MRIVFRAKSVESSGAVRGNGSNCLSVAVTLDESDAANLLYTLWADYGDEWFESAVRREGFVMSKTTQEGVEKDG